MFTKYLKYDIIKTRVVNFQCKFGKRGGKYRGKRLGSSIDNDFILGYVFFRQKNHTIPS